MDIYTVEDFEGEVLEGEAALASAHEEPAQEDGQAVIVSQVSDADIKKTARSITRKMQMGLNFLAKRQGWEPVQKDEFEEMQDIWEEVLSYHPNLAKGGRIFAYIDLALCVPAFVMGRAIEAEAQSGAAGGSPKKSEPEIIPPRPANGAGGGEEGGMSFGS